MRIVHSCRYKSCSQPYLISNKSVAQFQVLERHKDGFSPSSEGEYFRGDDELQKPVDFPAPEICYHSNELY